VLVYGWDFRGTLIPLEVSMVEPVGFRVLGFVGALGVDLSINELLSL
jgi:hypothetical protein